MPVIIHWSVVGVGAFILFSILIGGMRKSKTTWTIRNSHEFAEKKDHPMYLVFKKTGLFSKEYIGHRRDLYGAECLTGKHSNLSWSRNNRIILKL